MADHNVMPGYHVGDVLPNENKKKRKWYKNLQRKMYDYWHSY